jgi:hypothetical protein
MDLLNHNNMKNIKEVGYEHYLVSEDGKVYNSLSGKELKSYPNKNTGYMTIVLSNGIKPKACYVHRLVALVYISNPLNFPEVNHKNHIRSDNSVSNLEWVTKKQNIQHAYSNKEKKLDKILKDKKIIQQGIEHYKWNKDMNYLKKLWNTSSVTKILELHNIERSRFKIPNNIRIEIIKDIKIHNMKHGKFINYIKDKYNIHFTRFHLINLKKML